MNTKIILSFLLAIITAFGAKQLQAAEKTTSEKTAEAWDATKKTTKDVTQKVMEKTKEVASAAEAAVTKPDSDAKKVEVKVTDKGVQLPSNLAAGKTAFVVKNTGKQAHNFRVEGSGLKKSFWFDVHPNDTKIMQVDLKPGTYQANSAAEGETGDQKKVTLTVK